MKFIEDDTHKKIKGVPHKLCSTCKTWVPVENFSNRKVSKDGLAYSCKPCERETAQRSYERAKAKKKQQKRYQENKEVYIERAKQRYEENKEQCLAQGKAWRESDSGKKSTRAATARRVTRIKEQTPGGCDYTRADVIKRDSINGVCMCQICFKPILDIDNDMQVDHIVTIAAGGADVFSNVRATHKTCNLKRPKDGGDL